MYLAMIAASVVSVIVSLRHDYRPAAAILLALVAMRFTGLLDYQERLIASAVVWFVAASYIVNQCRASLVAFFVLASGLCYIWARLTLAPIEFMSLPFVVSDILCVAAMVFAGVGNGNVGIGYRGGNMGDDPRLYRHSGGGKGVVYMEAKESR